MQNFKSFKRIGAAYKAANGGVIVRIGNLYLVPETQDKTASRIASVELIAPVQRPKAASCQHEVVGQVTLFHLNRLGNANHATPGEGWTAPQFFTAEG